jgi:hypothetical protein
MKAIKLFLVILSCVFIFTNAHAGKPTDNDGNFIGNGYPSGPHFNLNIHGKNGNFTCPVPQYLVEVDFIEDPLLLDDIEDGDRFESCPAGYACIGTNEEFFGNVINLPRDGSDVQIYMESGRKGPKSNPTASTLEVTDWCTKPFDNDPASFRLPADPDGYAVYSRVTGKQVDDQFFQVFGRTLTTVEIECQSTDTDCPSNGVYDLLLLGVVTNEGAFLPVGGLGADDFQRTDDTDNRGGKGVKNATEITGMFEFSGDVCYIYADDPACTSGTACAATEFCCPIDDTTFEYNGACEALETPKFWDGFVYDCSNAVPPANSLWSEETFYCREYIDAWIFNIADFVEVLFDVRNNDTYNIKLRFYPLPLQESKQKP